MGNKTKLLAVIVTLLILVSSVAACSLRRQNTPTCTEHTDTDGNGKCDSCGANVPSVQSPACTEHTDTDGNGKCDSCGANIPSVQPPACTEHTDTDGNEKCDSCGANVPSVQPPACTEHTDTDGNGKCDSCGANMSVSKTEYTLTFVSQGKEIGTVKVKNGDSFTAPTPDRGDEYIFLGWKNEKTGEMITDGIFNWNENVTLVAIWDTVWSEGF